MELPAVVPVPIVPTDWAGEPCWEDGDAEDMLMAEGGTATSWLWDDRSVLTWVGRARRVW